MKRLLLALTLVLLTALSASAQSTLSTTTCPGAGCTIMPTNGQGSIGIQITGTFVGTLQFEQSIDRTTWVSLTVYPNGSVIGVTAATATGYWTGSATGATAVRVRFSAFTSGTASVSLALSNARRGVDQSIGTMQAGTGTQTGKVGAVTIFSSVTAVGSIGGGGNTDVLTYTMPANTLSADGQSLRATASFLHAANTNATSLWLKVFGTLATGGTCAVSGGTAAIDLIITRISSTVATVTGIDNGCASLVNEAGRRTGVDFTAALTLIITINAATTTNDLLTQHFKVVWSPE